MPIKNIIISQAVPNAYAPYEELTGKYGVNFDFVPFQKIVPLSSREMRAQRCNILEYSAIVLSSRSTIDAFFSICEDLRVKIPETMKYFCTTEMVAMYLQKHIIYRKRKIFFGDGTPDSVLNLIGTRHKDENFLIVTSNTPVSSLTKAFDSTSYRHTGIVFAKSVPCDIKSYDIQKYDLMVLYNKNDVAALLDNFPEFRQDGMQLVTYGSESLKKAVLDAGLKVAVSAPCEKFTTVASAIEHCITSQK